MCNMAWHLITLNFFSEWMAKNIFHKKDRSIRMISSIITALGLFENYEGIFRDGLGYSGLPHILWDGTLKSPIKPT